MVQTPSSFDDNERAERTAWPIGPHRSAHRRDWRSGRLGFVDLSALMLRDGIHARAAGRVVGVEGRVWFEPPLPVPLIGYLPGHKPAPRPSSLAVRASGVDLDMLSDRFEKDGSVSGWATLTGLWRGGLLEVVDQREEWRGRSAWGPSWTTPPCPPPARGWPEVPEGSNIEPAPPEAIPGMVAVVSFRPTPTQLVLVVATSEPDAAEAMLRPLYGDALCVVPSRWKPTEIEAVRTVLEKNWRQWGVYEFCEQVGEDAQVTVTAKVVHVVASTVVWSRSLPDGIAEITAWLRPLDPPPSAP